MITFDLVRLYKFKCGECNGTWQIENKKPYKILCPHCGFEDRPVNNNDLAIKRKR